MGASRMAAISFALVAAGSGSASHIGPAPQAGAQITIVKEVEPDSPTDFFFTLAGPTSGGAQLDDDGTTSPIAKSKSFAVAPGAYQITEQDPGPGWTFAGARCTGAAGQSVELASRTVTLRVAPGAKIVCTIFNRRAAVGTGKITIIKDAMPDHVQDFRFRGTGPGGWSDAFALDDDLGVAGGNSNTPNAKAYVLPSGTYVFTEMVAASGWNLAGIRCTPTASATIDLASARVSISLQPTSNVVCIFYNKQ